MRPKAFGETYQLTCFQSFKLYLTIGTIKAVQCYEIFPNVYASEYNTSQPQMMLIRTSTPATFDVNFVMGVMERHGNKQIERQTQEVQSALKKVQYSNVQYPNVQK
jgi:hypothetical protein